MEFVEVRIKSAKCESCLIRPLHEYLVTELFAVSSGVSDVAGHIQLLQGRSGELGVCRVFE